MVDRRLFVSGVAFTGLVACAGQGSSLLSNPGHEQTVASSEFQCPDGCHPNPTPQPLNQLQNLKSTNQVGATSYSAILTDNSVLSNATLSGSQLTISNKQYNTSYLIDFTKIPAVGQRIPILNGTVGLSDPHTFNGYDSSGNIQATVTVAASASGVPTGAFNVTVARQGLNGVAGSVPGWSHACALELAALAASAGLTIVGGMELLAGAAAAPPTLGASAVVAAISFGGDVGFMLNAFNNTRNC